MGQTLSALEKGTLFLLNGLLMRKHAVHPEDLSRGMEISSARVAAMLNRLKERALIQREPAPRDNRQILDLLTESGRQLILQTRAGAADMASEASRQNREGGKRMPRSPPCMRNEKKSERVSVQCPAGYRDCAALAHYASSAGGRDAGPVPYGSYAF